MLYRYFGVNCQKRSFSMKIRLTVIYGFFAVLIALVFSACFSFPEPAPPAPKAPPPLKIGSIGPGGGKIFYISEAGFTVQMLDPEENYTAHYLEIAHGIEGSAWLGVGRPHAWSNGQTDIAGTEAAIGTGRKNTALILAADPSAPAAKVCYEFVNNGFDDWFLASVDETREIQRNAVDLGVGTGGFFWTSTQANSRNALNLGMRLEGISKSTTSSVWPIRAF
jgi:hypothetical protein